MVAVFVPLRAWAVASLDLPLEENGMHFSVMACQSSPFPFDVAHAAGTSGTSLAGVAMGSEATLLSANALATILYRFDS